MKIGDKVRLLEMRGPYPADSEGVITRDDIPGFVDIDITCLPAPGCSVVENPIPLIGVPTSKATLDTKCR